MATLLALVVLATVYLIATVGPQIGMARKLLAGNIMQLSSTDIAGAERHLQSARDALHGPASLLLRAVPLERQNIDAVRNSVDKTLPVLSNARALRTQLDRLERGGLVAGGEISLGSIEALEAPLRNAASSVRSLVATLRAGQSGWLVPSIWDGISNTRAKAEDLQRASASGMQLVKLVPQFLGATAPRRYLVLLVNNAEVRPSGGIVSGIGILKIDQGRVELGPFHYYTDLAKKPYRSVAAPPDFARRYGRFHADTTRWVNVTMSPDTEEVAKVAARLYKVTAGKTTDGAIVADPRGIAALLPKDSHVRVPGTHIEVSGKDLTRFVYSKAYQRLGGHTQARHGALIAMGRSAFDHFAKAGFGGQQRLTATAQAIAGGHLRFISFTASEEAILRKVGVSGALRSAPGDRVFVTSTNFNGTKLDFWSHQTIAHVCDVRSEGPTLCRTTVTVANSAPQGLSRYVAGRGPYGQLRSLVEAYVPEAAVLQRVKLDGAPATFSVQPEHGLKSVGVEMRVLPGDSSRLMLDYSLPRSAAGYRLEVTPQPLTHDADLRLTLRVPAGWTVSGGSGNGHVRGDIYEQEGRLSHQQVIEAQPYKARGLASWWHKFDDFWQHQIL